MATRLNQVLTFTNVAPAAIVALPHDINVNDVALRPDFVFRDNGDFAVISCTTTLLTVQNNGVGVATLNAWLERQHTIDRAYGDNADVDLSPQPFVPAAGTGGGVDIDAVIFDDSVPGTNLNIRADRALNNSPINNALTQITNLSSKDGFDNPAALGATGMGSTIGGGNDNTASGLRATVPGGTNNTASGSNSFACGVGSIASGTRSAAFNRADATSTGAFAANDAAASNTEAAAFNSGDAQGLQSFSINNSTAIGSRSFASGADSQALRDSQASHAGGSEITSGAAQTSVLVFRATTPGVGAGESVALGYGPTPAVFELENLKGYTIVVTAIARGLVGGAPNVQSFRRMFSVRRTAGLTTIAASGALEQIGDAASATWTLVASVGAAPDHFALTFSTGATTSNARIVADVSFVEVTPP
jgi:hypothetical protein